MESKRPIKLRNGGFAEHSIKVFNMKFCAAIIWGLLIAGCASTPTVQDIYKASDSSMGDGYAERMIFRKDFRPEEKLEFVFWVGFSGYSAKLNQNQERMLAMLRGAEKAKSMGFTCVTYYSEDSGWKLDYVDLPQKYNFIGSVGPGGTITGGLSESAIGYSYNKDRPYKMMPHAGLYVGLKKTCSPVKIEQVGLIEYMNWNLDAENILNVFSNHFGISIPKEDRGQEISREQAERDRFKKQAGSVCNASSECAGTLVCAKSSPTVMQCMSSGEALKNSF